MNDALSIAGNATGRETSAPPDCVPTMISGWIRYQPAGYQPAGHAADRDGGSARTTLLSARGKYNGG